ncbi:MAG: TerD family protein [Bacteroidia bacterium]|nr:TerD family protein [Bacteroidia bacterium]
MVESPDGKRPISADGSVFGAVDDLGNDDDDEVEGNEAIEVNLSKTSPNVRQILFAASIYWESGVASAKYNFGQVHNAYILIKNAITEEEILRYDLGEVFSEKGVEFGRLYRHNGTWKIEAIGIYRWP